MTMSAFRLACHRRTRHLVLHPTEDAHPRAAWQWVEVEAMSSTGALAQARRRLASLHPTPAQKRFLAGLAPEFADGTDPLSVSIELTEPSEIRLARRLAAQDLLRIVGESQAFRVLEIQLRFDALHYLARRPSLPNPKRSDSPATKVNFTAPTAVATA